MAKSKLPKIKKVGIKSHGTKSPKKSEAKNFLKSLVVNKRQK